MGSDHRCTIFSIPRPDPPLERQETLDNTQCGVSCGGKNLINKSSLGIETVRLSAPTNHQEEGKKDGSLTHTIDDEVASEGDLFLILNYLVEISSFIKDAERKRSLVVVNHRRGHQGTETTRKKKELEAVAGRL